MSASAETDPRDVSDELRAALEQRVRALRGPGALPPALLDVRLESVALPGGGATLVRPSDWPALREADRAVGRPTPYWALTWASGRALARAVARAPLAGRRVLDLGSGLGLVSVAAAQAGAHVTALDGSSDAVAFTERNLALNGVDGRVIVGDFGDSPALVGDDRPEIVLAADVLYQRRNVDLLLDLLPRLLEGGGEAWIADPGRTGWDELRARAKRRWRISSELDREHPQAYVHRLTRRM